MPKALPITASVEVVKAHPYDGTPRRVGETYDAEVQYIATLEALGYVRRITEDKPKRRGK